MHGKADIAPAVRHSLQQSAPVAVLLQSRTMTRDDESASGPRQAHVNAALVRHKADARLVLAHSSSHRGEQNDVLLAPLEPVDRVDIHVRCRLRQNLSQPRFDVQHLGLVRRDDSDARLLNQGGVLHE